MYILNYIKFLKNKPIIVIVEKLVKEIGLYKGKQRIPKGVIHIQASFNNTIVDVTNICGQAVS